MSATHSRLAWGILGTGRIAGTFAKAIGDSKSGHLVAVASREQASANRFVAEHAGGAKVTAHGSYEALLEDTAVAAVYISTPHPLHAEWAIRAARAGKHILCEKPAALNQTEMMAIAEAAREHGVFFMEAFMYRAHPQTKKVVEIVRSGVLGEIQMIRASFGFRADFNPTSRLYRNDLGGGGILDVGCYPMSMVRLIAGAAGANNGLSFAEPVSMQAIGKLHPETGVDEKAVAIVSFANGIIAQLSTAISVGLDNTVTIHGSNGTLHIPSPWLPEPVTTLELKTKTVETIQIDAGASLYSFEVDEVAQFVAAGESPSMPIADSLGNMAALDQWRTKIGLIYKSEALDAVRPALPPLRRKGAHSIPDLYRTIPGLEKPISRLVIGTMPGAIIEPPNAFALYDLFTEYGGNCFDTAHIYGSEKLFGQWLRQRGNRDQTVVIAKGAHTPNCYPDKLIEQLEESLDNLQITSTDIYMMHRDNPEVPVGEFVDVLNQLRQQGKIKVFGGSNWSIERINAANAYAREKGLQGFSVLSNQFSLARMCDPVWAGCVSCSDTASRSWLEQEQMPLFAWSSQARGFFVRGSRSFTEDMELARCWYSEDNFERLCRTQELARRKGSAPIHIAAAYVLAQRFPLFALIGPRTLAEVSSCFESFNVQLSPEEMAWLNLES